jgi:hypothetical protein
MNTYMRRVCAPEVGPLASRVQRPSRLTDAGLRAAGSSIGLEKQTKATLLCVVYHVHGARR